MSGLRSSRNLLEAPMVIRMVLAVRKHLEMAIIIILNNPEQPQYKCNFSQNSVSGEVLALALHIGVFGAGLHPDGPGCPEKP